MKKKMLLFIGAALFVPTMAFGASTNGQGTTAGNSNVSSGSQATTGSAAQTQATTETQTATQNRENNPGVGTMAEAQVQEQARIQTEISESAPKYEPSNARAMQQRSVVSNAVQALLQIANKDENQGIGQQIKAVAQIQSQNQDKIGQSIDKTETRSGVAKFFIGANYSELKLVKQAMVQNREQIKELQTLMTQVSGDADKMEIANQIIALQQENLALSDEVDQLDNGFSLFGWLVRWVKGY